MSSNPTTLMSSGTSIPRWCSRCSTPIASKSLNAMSAVVPLARPISAAAIMGAVMTVMGGFTPGAFRVAWLVQYPVWLMAVIGVLIMRHQARRLGAARGVIPRPPGEVIAGSSVMYDPGLGGQAAKVAK
jgi:hypothetical protein